MNHRPTGVIVETGARRTFASAVDWPGWARSARSETEALERLAAYGVRYATVAALAGEPFEAPATASDLTVIERVDGNPTTDFGAPGVAGEADARALDAVERDRHVRLLRACWGAFDAAAREATGLELAKGPRGGGRDLQKMTGHVLEAERAYLGQLGVRAPAAIQGDVAASLTAERRAAVDAIGAAERGELATVGSRGGRRWTLRYFIRRAAWHALDHAWEIEDRTPREVMNGTPRRGLSSRPDRAS